MKLGIYGRFQVEVRREHDAWIVYRSELGKRSVLNDVVLPPELAAQDIAMFLDDIFHELAGPGQNVEPVPEKPWTLFFLPGALGRTEFWHPVAGLLTYPAHKRHLSWPGSGGIPPNPAIKSLDDPATRELHVIPGGGHDLACAFARQVAPLIDRHLAAR